MMESCPKCETPENPQPPRISGGVAAPLVNKHDDMKQVAKELHDISKQLKLLNDILRRKG